MQISKKRKRFWGINQHRTEGFTLVELIVVIAILAILGGIGVPAYSGYVKKANMATDQTLIRDVKQALELYYYSHPEEASGAYVILNQEGSAPVFDDNNVGKAALEAVFGTTDAIALKYEDWQGETSTLSYKESSYYGKESSLINTVDTLTSALGKVITNDGDQNTADNLIGANFGAFLDDANVDKSNGKAVGNAAVLYVAQNTQGKQQEIQDAFNAGLSATAYSNTDVVNNLYSELHEQGITDSAALAVIYAYAEGYAQYSNQADAFHNNTDFSSVKDVKSALTALGNSFESLKTDNFKDYVTNQGRKDLTGYIDMMGTVNNNADVISGNLHSNDCFTDGTVENMLKGHAAMSALNISTSDGQVAVVLVVNSDGSVMTHVTPINWNS